MARLRGQRLADMSQAEFERFEQRVEAAALDRHLRELEEAQEQAEAEGRA